MCYKCGKGYEEKDNRTFRRTWWKGRAAWICSDCDIKEEID